MRNLFSVSGKSVLITGGNRGIGRMIAEGFVENGARVYVASRDGAACEIAADDMARSGVCFSAPGDISTSAGIDALAAAIRARESVLDVLINNAGVTNGAPIDDFGEADWDAAFDVNVKGVFFLTQQLLPLLRGAVQANGTARIINITSIAGLRPPPRDSFAYAASKAGSAMLTRHMAKRLAPEGIRVNAIAPGPFVTDMTAAIYERMKDKVLGSIPIGRVGSPEDIAGVAMFLASRASDNLTGAIIPCDGGSAQV